MEQEPIIRVVHGTPTAEEVAALVAVVLSGARQTPPAPEPPVSRWARSARPTAGFRFGRDAWRASALPR
ncbi:MAG TPA: acyl-CoA carboxylase subunit epsilon [Micromonosporaceae bacterium]